MHTRICRIMLGSLLAVLLGPAVPAAADLAVTQVRVGSKEASSVGLGDRIEVTVAGLDEWRTGAGGKPGDPTRARLVIDGRPLEAIAPQALADGALRFDLEYTSDDATRREWNKLFRQKGWNREVALTVRLPGEPSPTWARPRSVQLRIIETWWFGVWAVVFLALLASFVALAWKSDLLRDSGPPPRPGPDPLAPPRKPFSLARCQMAFWFFVIVAVYLFIGMITGNWESLTVQAATLMGISAATSVAASTVDATKRGTLAAQRSAAAAEETTLRARAAALVEERAGINRQLQAVPPPSAAEALRQTYAQKQIEQNTVLSRLHELVGVVRGAEAALAGQAGERFDLDILSDATGVTFHRFQMAAWTLVLGIVFVTSTYRNLVMQEFSDALLLLMGISGGAYVGFKIPERTG